MFSLDRANPIGCCSSAREKIFEASVRPKSQHLRDRESVANSQPFSQRAGKRTLSEGYYAHAGTQVFDFLDTRNRYLLANFREGERKSIRPGMTAEIYLLSNPDRRFAEKVEGISPGVQSQDDNGAVLGVPLVTRHANQGRQRCPKQRRLIV